MLFRGTRKLPGSILIRNITDYLHFARRISIYLFIYCNVKTQLNLVGFLVRKGESGTAQAICSLWEGGKSLLNISQMGDYGLYVSQIRHICELTSVCAFSTWIFHSEGSCSRDGYWRSIKSDHGADSYRCILRTVKQKSSFIFLPRVQKLRCSFVFIHLKLLVPIWQHLEKVSQHCANYAVTPVMSLLWLLSLTDIWFW